MNYDLNKYEFEILYDKFRDTLPNKNSGKYAQLYTKAQNKPFKVYKNTSGITVNAFSNNSTDMAISKNQLKQVYLGEKEPLYKSYEPILLDRILQKKLIQNNEIFTEDEKLNILQDSKNNLNIKNIILYGVPGVGKTHNINKLINLIEEGKSQKEIFDTIKNNSHDNSIDIEDIKDRVEFITFHQSFGYEDFIEGFRPSEDGKIELVDGVFKSIVKKAEEDKAKNYYLVIDEINRGNISKIFGELITLIEESKRDNLKVKLPYSKEPFSVPSNLFIIGTMNSTDKSIALIDIALRRRFTFLKMEPNVELVHESAKDIFVELNKHISETIGSDYRIGHSYFMGDDIDMEFIKEYKIKPLLEEYFYGDEENLKTALAILP